MRVTTCFRHRVADPSLSGRRHRSSSLLVKAGGSAVSSARTHRTRSDCTRIARRTRSPPSPSRPPVPARRRRTERATTAPHPRPPATPPSVSAPFGRSPLAWVRGARTLDALRLMERPTFRRLCDRRLDLRRSNISPGGRLIPYNGAWLASFASCPSPPPHTPIPRPRRHPSISDTCGWPSVRGREESAHSPAHWRLSSSPLIQRTQEPSTAQGMVLAP